MSEQQTTVTIEAAKTAADVAAQIATLRSSARRSIAYFRAARKRSQQRAHPERAGWQSKQGDATAGAGE